MKFIIDNKIPFIAGRLENAGAEVVYADPAGFTPDLVADADALIVRTRTKCDRSLLEGSKVRLVATATIGTDHIDIPWCGANGITVRNAAGCNAPGVAQYVWSSLLRLGFRPGRDTLGVVGHGHVGSIVTEWGRRMGARVIVCDPPRKRTGMTDNDYLSLRQVLAQADAVTLHTPLTKTGDDATYHIFGDEEFAAMHRDAILVNSSRGPVVDNAAWLRHIRSGGGKAVIDTWEGEPSINLDLLKAATVATPHIAGYSLEGKQRATRMALQAVEEFFGISVDVSGLCGPYVSPGDAFPLDATARIIASYNPLLDTAALKAAPGDFERLRGDYDYRREPILIQD